MLVRLLDTDICRVAQGKLGGFCACALAHIEMTTSPLGTGPQVLPQTARFA